MVLFLPEGEWYDFIKIYVTRAFIQIEYFKTNSLIYDEEEKSLEFFILLWPCYVKAYVQ